jgi:hypothetical protein
MTFVLPFLSDIVDDKNISVKPTVLIHFVRISRGYIAEQKTIIDKMLIQLSYTDILINE